MKLSELRLLTKDFLIREISKFSEVNTGNINSTFLLTATDGSEYILQRINKNVFEKPEDVMQNIRKISRYLKRAVLREGGNPELEVLHPIETLDNTCYTVDSEGQYWRMYDCIQGAQTYDTLDSTPIDNLAIFYEVGKAFGKFQERLIDFPAEILHEAIPDFHNTPKRFMDLKNAICANKVGRLNANQPKELTEIINYLLSCEDECRFIEVGKLSGKLPLRVTHNDTKLNNVMISNSTGEAVCVIDLDTTGPDSILADYGDAVRSGTNKAGELCTNLDEVMMDLDLFEAYTRGYLEYARSLSQFEIQSLYKAPRILTLELAVRFLADYINGDEYFKLKPGESMDLNLTRAMVQYKLSLDMKQKEEIMKQKIEKIYEEIEAS